jgi:hypothetical protein
MVGTFSQFPSSNCKDCIKIDAKKASGGRRKDVHSSFVIFKEMRRVQEKWMARKRKRPHRIAPSSGCVAEYYGGVGGVSGAAS